MSSSISEYLKGINNSWTYVCLIKCRISYHMHLLLFADTVTVLINAIGDNDNTVNNVIIKSLVKISNVHPNEVIEIFCEFYRNTVKSNVIQLGNLVKYVMIDLVIV